MSSSIRTVGIHRFSGDIRTAAQDAVAVEAPLEIRILHWFKDVPISTVLAVTMRSPGADQDLIAGYLLTEGIVERSDQILSIRALGESSQSNEYVAELGRDVDIDPSLLARPAFLYSGCGTCGHRSLPPTSSPYDSSMHGPQIASSVIRNCPDRLRQEQAGFDSTGGLHAAALFSATGVLEFLYEDVGRHNALDKLIGRCLLANALPLDDRIIFMSSRGSYELVAKAVLAGCRILACVGAPSSLAIELAKAQHLTLVGFVRDQRFNVYSGDWRIHSK
jgi:FdhD protein